MLKFLDREAFDPVLDASPEDYSGDDRQALEEMKRKTEQEKRRYHEDYSSAHDIRVNFMRDLSSEPAQRVHRTLERLRLPALPHMKDEFLRLCDELGVR